jgi:hypothetical protein
MRKESQPFYRALTKAFKERPISLRITDFRIVEGQRMYKLEWLDLEKIERFKW